MFARLDKFAIGLQICPVFGKINIMIKRTLEKKLKQLWAQFPIITLTGPRQSGKTVKSDFFTGLSYWNTLSGQDSAKSLLIYGCEKKETRSLGTVLGWRYATEALKS